MPDSDVVHLSRNEYEALCSKAARGAGLSWGLAEEAGFAASWFMLHSVDSARVFLQHFMQVQHRSWDMMRPVPKGDAWQAVDPDLSLCPIVLGVSISDHLCVEPAVFNGSGLRILKVSYPGLLLPFLSMSVKGTTDVIRLQCGQYALSINGTDRPSGELESIMKLSCAPAQITAVDPLKRSPFLRGSSGKSLPIDIDVMNGLTALAMRTTVPSSPASRANAGAQEAGSD